VSGLGRATLLTQGQNHAGIVPSVPVGFALGSYRDQAATVRFHVKQRGLDFDCTRTVQWVGGRDGDWRILLAGDGGTSLACRKIQPDEAKGFITWGPRP
jgi:hypothetical protein